MHGNTYHTPVLLNYCIEGLDIKPNGIYVDTTFGGGGHSRAILEKLTTGKLIAFDCDEDAHKNKINDARFTLINQNFRMLKKSLAEFNINAINGLLVDLGVSSHQFDSSERGFSTRYNAPLDMRMAKTKHSKSAVEVLQSYSEEELKRMFWQYGELKNASQIVKKLIEKRKQIYTVNDLKNAIAGCAERGKENQFYAKVFQALRIEINDELNALKELLMQSTEVLMDKARLVVISYHSLEDRLVKNFSRSGNFEGEIHKDIYGNVLAPFIPVTKKPLVPSEEEIIRNSRSRSAKLRIAERKIVK